MRSFDSESWSKARAAGDGGEFLIAKWWEGQNFRAGIRIGKTGSDIVLGSSCEVKTDLLAKQTGNLAIEISCRGKPSGISTTDADWWAFVVSEKEAYVASVAAVRHAVMRYAGNVRRGGDDNASELVLVPLAEVLHDARWERIDLSWV